MVQTRTMMPSSMPQTFTLVCHPETYGQAVRGIEVRVGMAESGEIALTYTLKGKIVRLKIPPARPPRRADFLWEHTCFEAFVAIKSKREYYEFNFAPSGEWAVYAFRRYRENAPLVNEEPAPRITSRSRNDSFELDAVVRLDRLSLVERQAPLRLALCAVIEENDGMLSYWSLKHPPGNPDFHHPDSFALELESAAGEARRVAPIINPPREKTSGE